MSFPSLHHEVSRKLFYGTFLRTQFLIFAAGFTPLLIDRYLNGNINSSMLRILLLLFSFSIIAGLLYSLVQYTVFHKTLKPVAHLAEIGDTAGKVAHDLRGPMAGIESVLRELEDLESRGFDCKPQRNLLHLSYDRLGKVAQDLLLKQQGKEEAARVFDLREVLDRLIGEYESQSALIHVAFRREYADRAVTVCGQENKITRMFGNLVKNGLEAMNLEGSLTIRTAATEESVQVTISDSGPGMTAATAAKILSGESFTDGKSNGHGIGLSVVREVLKSHRGEMEIKSVLGKGTDFVLTFPLAPASESPVLVNSEEVKSSRGEESGPNVLVIDDEPVILLAWEIKREKLGIGSLATFKNLESFTASGIDPKEIDIAFIDKNIEGSQFNGVEVLRYLRQKEIPKIVIASGENSVTLSSDPRFADANHILSEKIPDTLEGLV